jgi:hypothetical protein
MTHLFLFKPDFSFVVGDQNARKSSIERVGIKKAGKIVFTCFLNC